MPSNLTALSSGDPTKAKLQWPHDLQLPSRSKHDECAKQRARANT